MKSFHSFRLDPVNQCLWRENTRVPLAPKPFAVLRYLVDRPGRLVTQDELLEALWPNTYVQPEVLRKYILAIRNVLGDQAKSPQFIETLPKRGYQFVAAVADSTAAPPDSAPAPAPGLVGRAAALAKLAACFDEARRGRRQLVFVTGEAGIGKTTLVDQLQRTAAANPEVRIARGQCVEGFGGKEPYYPLLEAVGQLLRNNAFSATFASQAPTWLVQFPAASDPAQRESLQKEIFGATRERMVRELSEALESLTAETPLILILEDLHWVDHSTLDAISALARRRAPAKLLIVATYRPVEVILAQSPLKALKQDLLVHHLCNEVILERLAPSDIAEYLAARFPESGLPAALSAGIHKHSDGNPLFMVTIVDQAVANGWIAARGGTWQLAKPAAEIGRVVPDTLREMLEVQLDVLSAAEKNVLRCASVAGDRFSTWSLAAMLEVEETALEDACETLAARRSFIRAAGDFESAAGVLSVNYEFRHSLYREVLYRALPATQRMKYHRALARRMESAGHAALAAEIALHFEQCREFESAIRHLVLASQAAAGRYAHHESVELLEHALELLPALDEPGRPQLELEILRKLGDAHYALGDMPRSADVYETLADRAGAEPVRIEALLLSARPAAFFDPDRSIAVCERARGISAAQGDQLLEARSELIGAGWRILFDGWRGLDMRTCAAAAEQIRRRSPSGLPPYDLILYSNIQCLAADYRGAIESAGAGIAACAGGPALWEYFAAHTAKSVALAYLGEWGQALRLLETLVAMAGKNGHHPWMVILLPTLASLHMEALDADGARRLCLPLLDGSIPGPPGLLRSQAAIVAGLAELARGELHQARACFTEVRDRELVPKFTMHWYWRAVAHYGLSAVFLAERKLQEAAQECDRFVAALLPGEDRALQSLAWTQHAQIAMARGDFAPARHHLDQALALQQPCEIPLAAWRVHAAAFQLHAQDGQPKQAETHRRQAQAIILKLAASLEGEPQVRASFLAAGPVRAVLRPA